MEQAVHTPAERDRHRRRWLPLGGVKIAVQKSFVKHTQLTGRASGVRCMGCSAALVFNRAPETI
jgi:hypothetical protein